jgi:hypothetical protein
MIESKGGIIFAGNIARKIGLEKIKSSLVKNAGVVIAIMFGLMVEGKRDYESAGGKRGSILFQEAFGLPNMYAKETVRLYAERMAANADEIIIQLRESNVKIIKQGTLHRLWIDGSQYLPLDIDTTTMDNSKSKKEGVSRTYQGYDGYHPIIAYTGWNRRIYDRL